MYLFTRESCEIVVFDTYDHIDVPTKLQLLNCRGTLSSIFIAATTKPVSNLSMVCCVFRSTIPGVVVNPTFADKTSNQT